MKLIISAITGNSGLAQTLQKFNSDFRALIDQSAETADSASPRPLFVTFVDESPEHFHESAGKKAHHLHIGYAPEVFKHPQNREAVVRYVAEAASGGIRRARRLSKANQDELVAVLAAWSRLRLNQSEGVS